MVCGCCIGMDWLDGNRDNRCLMWKFEVVDIRFIS